MTDETDEWGYGLGGLVWIPDVEEAYPKPSDKRSCTCHPDDNPPVPCPRKFAYIDCLVAARQEQDRVWKLLVQAAKN